MALIPGTYIEKVESGNEAIDTIINVMTLPTLEMFEQLTINYEQGTVVSPRELRFTYGNWNSAFTPEVFLNNSPMPISGELYEIDYEMGRMRTTFELQPGDAVQVTYCFNYFPPRVLEGFIKRALIVVNTSGEGKPTTYTIDDVPNHYLGVIADLVVEMAMEKLLLEYDLWKGRLIYAISANNLYDGSGDIASQLEALKNSAHERAETSLQNAQLKNPNHLSGPTAHYFEALLAGSSARYKNGNYSYGPLRGAKFNRLTGPLPRQ